MGRLDGLGEHLEHVCRLSVEYHGIADAVGREQRELRGRSVRHEHLGAPANAVALGDLFVPGWNDRFATSDVWRVGCMDRHWRDAKHHQHVLRLPRRLDRNAAALGFPQHRVPGWNLGYVHMGNASEQHARCELQLSVWNHGATGSDVRRMVGMVR